MTTSAISRSCLFLLFATFASSTASGTATIR